MKKFDAIKSTVENVASLEVNVDTVYIRTNIERIETEDFAGWQYDEIQYSLREYQELVGGKTEMLEIEKDTISQALFEIAEFSANQEQSIYELAEILGGM